LFGVPQPAKYHPEIDTGVHVMLVLDQAARLSPDLAVRFAALLHDLGKGATPKDILPHHYGHEERSVQLAEALCTRLHVPREYRELALLAARYHGLVHRVKDLRPETVLRLLKSCDAFRRPQRLANCCWSARRTPSAAAALKSVPTRRRRGCSAHSRRQTR